MPHVVETVEPIAVNNMTDSDAMMRIKSMGAWDAVAMDYVKTGMDVETTVASHQLPEVAGELKSMNYTLETLIGVDRQPEFEVLYLFKAPAQGPRVRVRMRIDRANAELPTLSNVFGGADWYEREVFDMFGINFIGHSHLSPLLLPHATDFHPLRKDFHGAPIIIPDDTVEIPELDVRTAAKIGNTTGQRSDFFLNMGPQHPSTHGVLRVLLRVEGETIISGRCHLGYSHRGTEKLVEKKQYVQILPYTDRIDYLAPLNYNWGYAKLLERATGIESTRRAEVIRVIMAELNRVASHLVWLGTYLLDLGAITPFLFCFEDRERILTIFERVTGQRMTASYIVAGGVRNDVYTGFSTEISALIKDLRKRLIEYERLVMDNEIFRLRTDGVGPISLESAHNYGISGPCLRGSGVDYDVRRDEPYCDLYQELEWSVPVESAGDCLARSRVRMRELEQSLNLVEQALLKLEDGPVRSKVPRIFKVPEGEYFSVTEGPRGLLGWYLIADGTTNPYRLKIRVPSFANLQIVEQLIPGTRVADVVSILGSLDVVIPEIDR